MSPAPFDIAPLELPPPAAGSNPLAALTDSGKTCGVQGGAFSSSGALPGTHRRTARWSRCRSRRRGPPAGGAGRAAGGPPPGLGGPPVDAATRLARSSLPELKKTSVKIMLANAELDPGADPAVTKASCSFNQILHDELCKEGPDHCPRCFTSRARAICRKCFRLALPTKPFQGPILAWMKKIK